MLFGRRAGSWSKSSLPRSIARRFLVAFAFFFVIVSLSFVALQTSSPGLAFPVPRAPAARFANPCATGATWGAGQPVEVQYVIYVANVFHGEWGASFAARCEPVLSLVLGHATDTLILTFGAVALSGLVARAAGPALARRHGRLADSIGSAAALSSSALPAVGLGLVLLAALMATGPGFPPVGDHSPDYATMPILLQIADYLAHLLVPLLAVVALSLGFLILAMRVASLYELNRRGPKLILESLAGGSGAPGGPQAGLPALLPELAVYLGWTMSASLLVEIAFGLDGLGSVLIQSAGWDLLAANGVFLFLSLVLVASLAVAGLIGVRAEATWLRPEAPIPGESPTVARFLREFMIRRASVVGFALLAFLIGLTLAAPALVGTYDPYAPAAPAFRPPSPGYALGTGAFGIDVLSEVIAGGAVPLLVAASSFAWAVVAGVLMAISAGIFGGRVDRAVGVLVVGLLCLPWLPLVALAGVPRGPAAYLLVAFLSWPIPAAILRRDIAEYLQSRGFLQPRGAVRSARRDVGSGPFWTRGTVRYLASVAPLIGSSGLVAASLSILVLSGIAVIFINDPFASGAPPSWPGWQTSLVYNWFGGIQAGAWYSILPFVLALFAASLAFAVLGFSLREAGLPFPLSRPWPKETGTARRKSTAVKND